MQPDEWKFKDKDHVLKPKISKLLFLKENMMEIMTIYLLVTVIVKTLVDFDNCYNVFLSCATDSRFFNFNSLSTSTQDISLAFQNVNLCSFQVKCETLNFTYCNTFWFFGPDQTSVGFRSSRDKLDNVGVRTLICQFVCHFTKIIPRVNPVQTHSYI